MDIRNVNFSDRCIALHGDNTDRYFINGFTEDGWQSVGPYLQKIIGPDFVCMDIGANIGLTSLAFGLLAKKGKVFAFEPSPRNFDYLEKNVKTNQLTNISAFSFAVAKTEGEFSFYDTSGFRAGSFLCNEEDALAARHHREDAIKVKTVALDEFVRTNGVTKVDFVKIDVEGFEHEVLAGAQKTLEKFRPITVIEFNPYCLVTHANYLPNRILDTVFELFDEVFVHREQENSIKAVKDIHDKHDLLHDAFKFGLVNLICSFKEHNLDAVQLNEFQMQEAKENSRPLRTKLKNKLKGVIDRVL